MIQVVWLTGGTIRSYKQCWRFHNEIEQIEDTTLTNNAEGFSNIEQIEDATIAKNDDEEGII